MTNPDRVWKEQLEGRFSDRTELPPAELFDQEFSQQGIDFTSFVSCCEQLASEFGIPVGKLRASDELAFIFKSPKARTPWQWLVFQAREGDSTAELEIQLRKRMKRAGTTDQWKSMITFSDFLRAWAGLLPPGAEADQ